MALDRREFLADLAAMAAMLAAGGAGAQAQNARRIGWPRAWSSTCATRATSRRCAPRSPELTRAKVAFIVSSGPAIRAVRQARDVPVLFAISGDPVEIGLAQSLAWPGGNFSGVTFLSLAIAGKRVELLKQAVPGLRTLAVLSNTDHPGERSERRATEEAARALGVEVAYVPFSGAAPLDQALAGVRAAKRARWWCFPRAPRWWRGRRSPSSPPPSACRRCSAGASTPTPAA